MSMKWEEMEEFSGFLYDRVRCLAPLFLVPGLIATLYFINYEATVETKKKDVNWEFLLSACASALLGCGTVFFCIYLQIPI